MSDQLTYEQTLDRWKELQEILPRLIAEERALREGLFNGTFPNPVEGVNKVALPDGRVLKGTYNLNRKILVDRIGTLPKKLTEVVIKYKPELALGAYRKLPEEAQKKVDSILEIKPGLPKLEIVDP